MKHVIDVRYENDDEEVISMDLPAKWEICHNCEGEGRHLRSSLRDVAFTGEEWDDLGYEFQDAYMNGGMDQGCEECNGTGKVLAVDERNLSWSEKEHWKRYCKWKEEDDYWRMQSFLESEAERRMGC